MLYVDKRYTGNHGIARYAAEVCDRLVDYRPLPVIRKPTSPWSILERGWRVPSDRDLIYSPGFGTGMSRAYQLLTLHDLIHLRQPSGRLKAAGQRTYYDHPVRRAIRTTGHVLTVSEASAREIRRWLQDDLVQIHITGNGCSSAFTPDGPSITHARPYILYVGNAKPHKNARIALESLRDLDNIDLVIVTTDTVPFTKWAVELGVLARVKFVTDVDDETLAAYYRGALALIFPSTLEGFGLPVLEALRCGTNVVYSKAAASVGEICRNTQFPVDDHNDPAEYSLALAAAASTKNSPPANLSKYDWDQVARRVLSTIELVAEQMDG